MVITESKVKAMNEQTNTAAMANRVPVSVVTGYLGAGKTTLINHLVQCDGMEDTALIINEFGEVGLDHVLVEKSFENTLLLENGCVCCTIRGDLIDTISDLFAKVAMGDIPAFTRILVETTGIADPGPIAASVMTDEGVVHRCGMEKIITLVDGVLGKSRITETLGDGNCGSAAAERIKNHVPRLTACVNDALQ